MTEEYGGEDVNVRIYRDQYLIERDGQILLFNSRNFYAVAKSGYASVGSNLEDLIENPVSGFKFVKELYKKAIELLKEFHELPKKPLGYPELKLLYSELCEREAKSIEDVHPNMSIAVLSGEHVQMFYVSDIEHFTIYSAGECAGFWIRDESYNPVFIPEDRDISPDDRIKPSTYDEVQLVKSLVPKKILLHDRSTW